MINHLWGLSLFSVRSFTIFSKDFIHYLCENLIHYLCEDLCLGVRTFIFCKDLLNYYL